MRREHFGVGGNGSTTTRGTSTSLLPHHEDNNHEQQNENDNNDGKDHKKNIRTCLISTMRRLLTCSPLTSHCHGGQHVNPRPLSSFKPCSGRTLVISCTLLCFCLLFHMHQRPPSPMIFPMVVWIHDDRMLTIVSKLTTVDRNIDGVGDGNNNNDLDNDKNHHPLLFIPRKRHVNVFNHAKDEESSSERDDDNDEDDSEEDYEDEDDDEDYVSYDNDLARFRPKPGCDAEPWMTWDASNCNTFHEVHMDEFDVYNHLDTSKKNRSTYANIRYINDGGFRVAWMIADSPNPTQKRVLKTLEYIKKRDFDLDNLERHRRDAIALEQLTSSPYIQEIYGHCAQSALVDYSQHDHLYHIFDEDESYPTDEELFEIAHDVVAAVADTHHYSEETGRATILHHDLKPHQFLYFDKPGRYQLGDFNGAKFLTWNSEKEQFCGHTSRFGTGRWRAPEQYRFNEPLSEKGDVYSLGNILYFLLTTEKPFADMDGDKAFKYIGKRKGRLTFANVKNQTFAQHVLNSTHPFHVYVRQAMDMCLELDPKKRPNARTVLEFLQPKFDEFQKKQQQQRKRNQGKRQQGND